MVHVIQTPKLQGGPVIKLDEDQQWACKGMTLVKQSENVHFLKEALPSENRKKFNLNIT
jgi:hypothetical protein